MLVCCFRAIKRRVRAVLTQTLAVGTKSEGPAVILEKNLLVVAAEADSPKKKFRSSITSFELMASDALKYTISAPREGSTGPFIPHSAFSGLSSYKMSRIFTMDTSVFPYLINKEDRIMDSNDVLSACLEGKLEIWSKSLILS